MSWKNISVTAPFLLLVAWLNYMDRQGVVLPALLACTLHELGHLFAIRLLGGDVKHIRLTVAGAEMGLSRGLSYWQELLAAAAGPAVNLLLSALCCRLPGGALFAGVNLALAAFNLLPMGRLDGGRIALCALSLSMWGRKRPGWPCCGLTGRCPAFCWVLAAFFCGWAAARRC